MPSLSSSLLSPLSMSPSREASRRPRHDWLVVGAGLTGATLAERIASQRGERVLVVDARPHTGGNVYDEADVHGVLVHRYGPHAFHTNSDRVWAYLSRFTAWHPYAHRVRADLGGDIGLVPVPFNHTALERCFGADAPRLAARLRARVGDATDHVPVLRLVDDPDPDVRRVARFVYERVFLGYTVKQWGRRPEELNASVTARVPIRLSADDRYFQDRHQATPADGFAALVARMLDHSNVTVQTGVSFEDLGAADRACRVVYTGPLDAYFGHALGVLPYRSLRFAWEHVASGGDLVQPVAQINHPDLPAVTRATEYRHMTGQTTDASGVPLSGTTLSWETPEAYVPGVNEPFYPIPHPDHQALYDRYTALAAAEAPEVVFAGRLADYRYYNMDQAVARALTVFDRRIAPL